MPVKYKFIPCNDAVFFLICEYGKALIQLYNSGTKLHPIAWWTVNIESDINVLFLLIVMHAMFKFKSYVHT